MLKKLKNKVYIYRKGITRKTVCIKQLLNSIVAPHYYAPRYYADSDITQSVVDPEFQPPGENAKWACLNLHRIASVER